MSQKINSTAACVMFWEKVFILKCFDCLYPENDQIRTYYPLVGQSKRKVQFRPVSWMKKQLEQMIGEQPEVRNPAFFDDPCKRFKAYDWRAYKLSVSFFSWRDPFSELTYGLRRIFRLATPLFFLLLSQVAASRERIRLTNRSELYYSGRIPYRV